MKNVPKTAGNVNQCYQDQFYLKKAVPFAILAEYIICGGGWGHIHNTSYEWAK